MISGVKRRFTATESTFRYFQTVDLIISHFKREADKKMIFELTSQTTSFKDLLIATAVVHIYHNLGIKVKDKLESNKFTYDSTKNLELVEKKLLIEEINTLLKDSFNLEINLLDKTIDLEDKFLSFLIESRSPSLQNFQREQMLNGLENKIEQELSEIVLKYPQFYFYDLIGDLIGLTDEIKLEILNETSAFKDLSIEIEKKLEQEEKEDQFIELATLNRMMSKIRKDFEFKSYKELQTQSMPVRMIKRKILESNFEKFPVSVSGLKVFKEANKLKKDLIKKIDEALNEKINYDQFENKILTYLKLELIKRLKTNPNDFIYFLQNLNESSFYDIIYALNKYGIYNILHLLNVDQELSEKIRKNLVRYNIKKQDIIKLNDQNQNIVFLAKKELCNLDFNILKGFIDHSEKISESNLLDLFSKEDDKNQPFFKFLNEKTGLSIKDIKETFRKKQVIDKVFIDDLKLKSYAQILSILNFEEVINKLAKEVYFFILSKILRQLSRIIELFFKVSNDKSLFLLGMKKIFGTIDTEEWIRIKLEELIIKRINKRQEELVVIFNAVNKPFLVNGFIISRLFEKSLNEGIKELSENDSLIYEGVKPLKLKQDLISPISYCIALDIIKRFERFELKRKVKVEQIIESKDKAREEKKREIREKQEANTLNWIERRITSSLMRISSPGINPNQLYWQEKDTKIATDNLKLHSELDGDPIELFCQFFNFVINKIKDFSTEIELPNSDNIEKVVIQIVEDTLEKRLGHKPSLDEYKTLLDGERLEVGKKIATKIGKLLNDALYSRFRRKRR